MEETNESNSLAESRKAFAHLHEPITGKQNEAGNIVFKLGNYMALHFAEIFTVIDRDLQHFGIRSYSIKNMTLEQVFIAIREEEIINEAKDE